MGKAPPAAALTRADNPPARLAPWPLELAAWAGWALGAAAAVLPLLAARWALDPLLPLALAQEEPVPLLCPPLVAPLQAVLAAALNTLRGLPLLFDENAELAPPRTDALRVKPGSSPPP